MRPDNFSIDELIDSLRGTCRAIAEELPDGMDEEELTEPELNKLDSEIFRCEICSWWHDSDDESEDGVCIECAEN